MANIEERYAELLRRGQDEALAALKRWNRTIRRAFTQLPTTGLTSAEQMIDEAYDYAAHVLDARRKFAKQLMATSAAAVEKARDDLARVAEDAPATAATVKSATAKAAR
jgi:hypothetical protein